MSVGERLSVDGSAASRYAAAISITAVALGVRLLMYPASAGVGFLTFYPALMLGGVIIGTGPGIVQVLLSALTGYTIFYSPYWSLGYKPDAAGATAAFALTGVGILWIARRMHAYGERWHRAADEARQSEHRYLAVIEDQTDVIFRHARDGTLLFVNDAFCRLLGKTRGELLGSAWTAWPVADDLPQIEREIALLTPANPIVAVESRFRPHGVELRWVQIINRGLFDAAGRLLEVQSVGRDLTTHKQLEAALEQARNAAVQANEFKSRFLAAASHDLRQPLQTIWTLHSLLARSPGAAELAPHLSLLEQAVRSMDDTLGALMDVNRLEKGVIVPVIRDFPVQDTLGRLRAEFTVAAADKNLKLEVDDSTEVARSDPMLLAVILRNLIGNAIKYTHEGGVHVRVRREDARLGIDVIDSGIGIPAEHLARVFDPFYQVDNSRQDQRHGVGLGLSIAQSMCRLLGHELTIDTRVGRGSTFTIRLGAGAVVREAAPPPRPPPRPAPAPRSRARTVLHIEDDPGIARSMGLLLSLEGYKIVHAATREEAMREVVEGLRPDLILCDFHLPSGQTGDQVVAALCNILKIKPPTIVLTGDISDKQIERAKVIADRILPKPVDIDRLLRDFDELLGDPGAAPH